MRFRFYHVLAGAVVVLALGGGLLAGASVLRRPAGASLDSKAPRLSFQTGDGRSVSLETFRGKTVLLNVWATWCPPCRKEMPSLDRLQASKGGDGFVVVALSIDKGGAAQVAPFFAEVGIRNLTTYLGEPGATMAALGIVGLPTTLLLDADGVERARWAGPKEWDSPAAVAEIDSRLEAPAPAAAR